MNLQVVQHLIHGGGLGPAVDPAGRREAVDDRDRGIGAAGEPEEQRFGLAVLRHHADAGAHRIGGRCERERPAAERDGAAVHAALAEKRLEQFALAHALQRADSQHLAGPELEGEIFQRPPDGEPASPAKAGVAASAWR